MSGEQNKKLVGVGLGAGLLGAIFFALKYAIRPAGKSPLPETISPAIFTTKVQHTSHGHLIYHEAGQGQPIIFLHSVCMGGSSFEWSKVYPAFIRRYRVLAPDLLGFGESQRPDAHRSASDYVQMLAEFIRATCWGESPIIVASGLSAGFCIQLAAQHPDLVSRLILHMPTGRNNFGFVRLRRSIRIAARIDLLQRFLYRNYHSSRASIKAWLMTSAFFKPAKVTEEMLEVFTTCAQQSGAEYAIRNFHSGRLNLSLEKRIAEVTVPITFLWGSEPAYPAIEEGRRLLQLARHGTLVTLPEVGAFAALEDPKGMITALEEQLASGLRVVES